MRIRVLLFAQMRLAAGCEATDLEVPEGSTLREALERLYDIHPALRPQAAHCMTAVGLDYAPLERVLRDGEEVSLIPPVQGG